MLRPPRLGAWTPTRRVSVVVPAYGGQAELDRTLAALARQTYPAGLLEVLVVDDNSVPALRLPERRPPHTKLVRAPSSGWGPGHARAHGAHLATGEILCWLDPDLVPDERHVEAHARWHHTHAEVVTVGTVFSASNAPDHAHPVPQRVAAATRGLRDTDHLGFRAYVGTGSAVPRWLYEETGGLDPTLGTGQDTEFGHRLWQAGAVLVAEPRAVAWYTDAGAGQALMRTQGPSTRLHRHGRLAGAIPQPRATRGASAPAPARVPLVRAVVAAWGRPLDEVRATVDALLSETGGDLSVALVAPWNDLDAVGEVSGGGELSPEDALELRLVQASYLGDARVVFTTTAPRTGFPAPYLLEVPVGRQIQPATVRWLVARADRVRVGLMELSFGDEHPAVRLWRCRALCRAQRIREPGESAVRAVARVHGRFRILAQHDAAGARARSDGEGIAAAVAGLPELTAEDPALRPRPVRWWSRLGRATRRMWRSARAFAR